MPCAPRKHRSSFLHSAKLVWRGGGLGSETCLVSVFGGEGQRPLNSPTNLQFLWPAQKALCDLSLLSPAIKWKREMEPLRSKALVSPGS